jgi:amidase
MRPVDTESARQPPRSKVLPITAGALLSEKRKTREAGRTVNMFRLTAEQAVGLLRAGEVSPSELVEAAAARIEAVDGTLNALPTRCLERAREAARRIEREGRERAGDPRWLGGLPVAIKDLNPVSGVRTTYGSPIYADHVPDRSDLLVERIEHNGGIVVAKSNTPEFAAGASTFNPVLGRTRNPWNTDKSVAGSSGGSAAALASGQVWLAQGSDLGGSLRTPASFNGVVGLRPSPGRVARGLHRWPYPTVASDMLFVEGPMARTARDCAMMLDAMAGDHREDPLSLTAPGQTFLDAMAATPLPRRVAFSPDLGIVPVDPEVAAVCERAARSLADLGVEVEEASPDLSDAIDCFQVLRAQLLAADHAEHLREHRELVKEDLVWNVEKGLALDGETVARAEAARIRIMAAALAFFDRYDLLLCPAAIVPPFDAEVRYVEEVAGHRFENYVHWLAITFAVTLTACPAACAPAGLSRDGLPIGLQIVGPPRADAAVLAAADRIDAANAMSARLPIDPRGPEAA